MSGQELLPCPCCGSRAVVRPGKQYKIMIQDWHDIEEERYQPCEVLCPKCGLSITRAACNYEHGGASGAAKEARRKVIEGWNTRTDTALRAKVKELESIEKRLIALQTDSIIYKNGLWAICGPWSTSFTGETINEALESATKALKGGE